MEELGIVAELVKSVRGEEGEDGKDGENCREDYKEEGIVFIARAEAMIKAVVTVRCTELKAVVKSWTDGGGVDAKGSPGSLRGTEEQAGSLL